MVEAHPLFAANPPEVRDSQFYYATVREWATALGEALGRGEVTRSELRKITDVCEVALAGGDELAYELVFDDLFNIVQGHLYRALEPARLFEEALGPRGALLWGDMLEDGVGDGIRDVATWSAVVRNGGVASFRREGPDGVLEWEAGPLDTDAAREAAWLFPLVAKAWIGERDVVEAIRPGFAPWADAPVATVEVEATDRPGVTILYGDASELGGRWIVCGDDVFVGHGWWEEG